MGNKLGGKNAHSEYAPMSELEQEVLQRLCDAGEFDVDLVGWGIIHSPKVRFGDLRVQIPISITFSAPAEPMPVWYFDLRLRTHSGIVLFESRESITYAGQPQWVHAGFHLDMVWDIALRHMNPALVKAVVPGAHGLTSKWLDRDTGDATLTGNAKLTSVQRDLLLRIRQGEHFIRMQDAHKLGILKARKRR